MNPRKPLPEGIKVGRRGVISSQPIPLEVVQRLQREEDEKQRRRQGQDGEEVIRGGEEATGEQPETGAEPTEAVEPKEGREVGSSDDQFFDAKEGVVESGGGEDDVDVDTAAIVATSNNVAAAAAATSPAPPPTAAEIAEARADKRRANSPAPTLTQPSTTHHNSNNNNIALPAHPHTSDRPPIVTTNPIIAESQYAHTTEMYRDFLASNNDPATNDTMTAGDYLETERNQALQLRWHRQEKMTEGRYNPIVSADAAGAFGRVPGAVGRWMEDDVLEGEVDGAEGRE